MNLAAQLLAAAVLNAPPGRSVYSAESMPECGTDPKHAECSLDRVCPGQSPLCAAPRWSAARGAWVRAESREAALQRYRAITDALARTARRLSSCLDEQGIPMEDCQQTGWPRGRGQEVTLAFAGLVTAIAESFLREDVMIGAPPNGVGPGGELSLIQVMPAHAPGFAGWLPKKERDRLLGASAADLAAWGRANLLGEGNLDHAFEVGLRALARSRGVCRGKGVAWTFGMWSMYGTGQTCSAGKWAHSRAAWYDIWYAKRAKTVLPDWALAEPSVVAATD